MTEETNAHVALEPPAGTTGLEIWSDKVEEEPLRELKGERWRRTIKEMVTDPVIGASLFAVEMLLRQVRYWVQPASDSPEDEEVALFVESCLYDMETTWADTLGEITSFLPWGWAVFELVYKRRVGVVKNELGMDSPLYSSRYTDGKIGWASWSPRGQETLDGWLWDQYGCAVGMWQLSPTTLKRALIPLDKALHFRTTSRKGNPEGKSVLRTAYRPWYFKKNIENIEGIGIERDLAGLPVVKIPASIIQANSTEYSEWKEVAVNLRNDEQAGLVIPSDVHKDTKVPLYDVQLLSTGGQRAFDTTTIIQRYNTQIAMTILADFLFLGHEKVGSFALSSDKTDLFSVALGAWLDSICAPINGKAIPDLLRLNGYSTTIAPPILMHSDIESADLAILGQYILSLSKVGIQLDEGQARYLLEQAHIPKPQEGFQQVRAPALQQTKQPTGEAAE